MKKVFLAAFIMTAAALLAAAPLCAASSWDELVAGLEKREMVRSEGDEFLRELITEAPQGSEYSLWKLLWVGTPRERAAAGVALMSKTFPGFDPSRWQEVSGFLAGTYIRPRQLAALDALFITVAALDSLPGGEWSAGKLLQDFSKSGLGMVMFIEQMPQGLKEPIGSVVAKTGISGDWSAKRTRRPLPLLPSDGGVITRNGAESRRLRYIDAFGRIANNGRYAWDRDRGLIYEVIEGSDLFWRFPH